MNTDICLFEYNLLLTKKFSGPSLSSLVKLDFRKIQKTNDKLNDKKSFFASKLSQVEFRITKCWHHVESNFYFSTSSVRSLIKLYRK